MCLGECFGEYELPALAALLLTRVRFELCLEEPPRIDAPRCGRRAEGLHALRPVAHGCRERPGPVAPIPLPRRGQRADHRMACRHLAPGRA
jgi:hypothetical protein